MYRYEPRDRSGPMDVDNHDPLERLARFALNHPDEGPSRKRLHSEMQTPSRPFNPSSSSSKPLHFGKDTPFMFHLPASSAAPFTPFKPYNPCEWTAASFGFSQSASGLGRGLEDVEMRSGDSPARPHEVVKEAENRTDSKEKESEGKDSRPMAGGAVARVRRRRQKDWRRGRGRGSESEGDGENVSATRGSDSRNRSRPDHPTKSEHHYSFHMPAPAVRHSEIPAILLGYLQFFVNASVVLFVLCLAVQFVLTVRRDVKDRMQEVSVEILQEIAECTKLYLTNRCDPTLRVPAMEAPCKAWEACMQRDPTMVGRTNVMAETFAGVINSFVDPISWKTMGFTLVTLSFLIILTNSALWNLRSRASSEPAPPHYPPPQYLPQPPQDSHIPHGTEAAAAPQIGWETAKKKGWW